MEHHSPSFYMELNSTDANVPSSIFLWPIVSSLMSNKFYEAWNLPKKRHATYPTLRWYNEKKLRKFQYQQQPFFWQNKYENCCSSPVLLIGQGTFASNLQFYFQTKWLLSLILHNRARVSLVRIPQTYHRFIKWRFFALTRLALQSECKCEE